MTQTFTSADALLKDLYVAPVIEQLNHKTWMLDQIERDSDHIDHTGRRAIFPVHYGRNRGRGSRGVGGAVLPKAGKQKHEDAVVPMRYHYSAIELEDPVIQASRSNEGAFVSVLQDETKRLASDMRKHIQYQVFGTGDGVLTTIRANSTSTTLNVNNVQYIHPGDVIDVLVASTGATTNGVVAAEVVSVDNTPGSEEVEIDTALGGTAGTTYAVYIHGSRGNEMDGLQSIIAQGRTLHGIDSSSTGNEFWDAQERDAGGNIAGENLFEQLMDDVGEVGNGEVDVFLTTRGIRRRLAQTYQSQKRLNDAKMVEIHGGYTAIFVDETPVLADDDAPKGIAFGLNKDSYRWYEQTKPGWMELNDSSVFHLKDASTPGMKMNVWQAWFRWYATLGCNAPNRNGKIINCEDDVPKQLG